jgi:hypothetical protein
VQGYDLPTDGEPEANPSRAARAPVGDPDVATGGRLIERLEGMQPYR